MNKKLPSSAGISKVGTADSKPTLQDYLGPDVVYIRNINRLEIPMFLGQTESSMVLCLEDGSVVAVAPTPHSLMDIIINGEYEYHTLH